MKPRSVRWISIASVKEGLYVIMRNCGSGGWKYVHWKGRSHPLQQVYFLNWSTVVAYADHLLGHHRLKVIDWGTKPLRYGVDWLDLRVRVERKGR